MRYLSTFLFLLFATVCVQAQDTPETIHDQVDQVATYPGGEGAWNLYLSNNFRYPDNAKAQKEQGTVVLNFVVEPSGRISNMKILESVSPALDENTAYMLYKSGQWTPGMKGGQAVRSRVTLPVRYQL
jgi:periplasmic protein TonB